MNTGHEPEGRDAAASGRPSTGPSGEGPTAAAPTAPDAGLVFDDPLDRPSADDADRGWGDTPSGTADDDFSRFLNEKPPHHL